MIIYFGIGTNLGNREDNLREALSKLDARVGEQLACSSIYRSAPVGFESDNEFANIVALYHTTYSPEEVLHITQAIEREMGRVQKSQHGIYHDRVIDIDLLQAMGDGVIRRESKDLTLPHPKMRERDFVMIPLAEIEDQVMDNGE